MSSPNHITALPLELHTDIFSNIQPYDILQVSQTCKALYHASSQRMVWTDALHRICVENTLFEPSFPVASMSVLELQRASMGPHRWTARPSSKERNSDGILPHSVTRHLTSTMSDLSITDLNSWCVHYLVPGGRYLFSISYDWLVLWDLGSPYSSGREPCSIAAVPVEFGAEDYDYLVHSTPDGMGLTISLCLYPAYFPSEMILHIYEIYPESTSPQLRQIAYTQLPDAYPGGFFYLSCDRLIIAQNQILTVWDYRANTWARWGFKGGGYSQVLATTSAVALIYPFGVVVWKIPPLLPESPLVMSNDPSIMSPEFMLQYPENQRYKHHQGPCGWYSGTPQPLYYDVEGDSCVKTHRFDITTNSTISGGTLNLLNTFEVPSRKDYEVSKDARICQDKNVSLCMGSKAFLLEAHVTDIYDRQLPSFLTPLSQHPIDLERTKTLCPVTGRLVYSEIDGWPVSSPCSIIVLDF